MKENLKNMETQEDTHTHMFVIKRSGEREKLSFDMITRRVSELCYDLSDEVDAGFVSQKVISGLIPNITTSEIDQQTARISAQMVNYHPQYAILAARLVVSDLHKQTCDKFSELAVKMYDYLHEKTGRHMPLISKEVRDIAIEHKDIIDNAIKHSRDMNFTYFGFMTLMRSYLLKMHDKVVETPQHMYMRVSIGIHGNDISRILETYEMLSCGQLSHASPTMFHSGTPTPQMASCFLLSMSGDEDSIVSIYDTLKQCAVISKAAGGIGLHPHTIRAAGSYIAGTNGHSNGLVPMLRVFDTTSRYVDQGGNKRPGAFAIYLEPWHGDIFEVLDMKLQTGIEDLRGRNLFYALWVPDLFMKRVQNDEDWTLMCPHECKGLSKVWGPEFEALYTKYETEKKGLRTIKAQKLWSHILKIQQETGTPYIMFKDSCNRCSNQRHYGTIESSNLCVSGDTEIMTECGPQAIRSLVHTPCPRDIASEADRLRTETELTELNVSLAGVERNMKCPKQLRKVVLEAKLESLAPAAEEKIVKSEKTQNLVKIWNGTQWTEVEPMKTAEKKSLMRITTSFGSIIDCTPEHIFILNETTPTSSCGASCGVSCGVSCGEPCLCPPTHVRCAASELHIGTRLIKTPPVVYDGLIKFEIPEDDAFRRGYIFAYGILKSGAEPANLGAKPPGLKVHCLVIEKRVVTADVLKTLLYSEKDVRKQFPLENHDDLAFILVEEGEQSLQTRLQAPLATRRAWVKGFFTGLSGNLNEAKASHAILRRPWTMIRSVGEDARMKPVGGNGLWQLTWPSKTVDDETPRVIGIQLLNIVEDTYCFTEPLEHAGVFNEQLTGQCAEIVQYSDPSEIAVCNLASVSLNKFVVRRDPIDGVSEMDLFEMINVPKVFNFNALHAVVKKTVVNLNRIIDRNQYDLEEMRTSNLKHRPIGIGIQGLADTFALLKLPWEAKVTDGEKERVIPHPEARLLNQQIFETMYHAALESSCELAEVEGTYETWPGCPASENQLQFDLWGVTPTSLWDWEALRAKIAKTGLRNSLLLTCMPTASTAQILGNNESFEPFTSNMYTRNVNSGEFQVVNKYLIMDLMNIGMWNEKMRKDIIRYNGSVQNIPNIPQDIKDVYKTVWEISQRTLIDMSADRGAFICQSQSFNLHMRNPRDDQLTSALFYAWERGLKTGMYYLRTRPACDPIKFTIDPNEAHEDTEAEIKATCARDNPGACLACST